jgi:hypothetical protein
MNKFQSDKKKNKNKTKENKASLLLLLCYGYNIDIGPFKCDCWLRIHFFLPSFSIYIYINQRAGFLFDFEKEIKIKKEHKWRKSQISASGRVKK